MWWIVFGLFCLWIIAGLILTIKYMCCLRRDNPDDVGARWWSDRKCRGYFYRVYPLILAALLGAAGFAAIYFMMAVFVCIIVLVVCFYAWPIIAFIGSVCCAVWVWRHV